jgi:hypothetical protein
MELHVNSAYPTTYNADAKNRFIYFYPTATPPYYYFGSLYFDGNNKGAHNNSSWNTRITNRMNVSAPARIRMWGTYNPSTGLGTIYARYFADGFDMSGNILFVITEDSIFLTGTNNDPLHNHVVRNYIPNYIGAPVTIIKNDSLTVSYPFTISSSWNDKQVEIVTLIQNPTNFGDSLKEVWQAAKIKPRQLSCINEEPNARSYFSRIVEVSPNPCVNETRFTFHLRNGTSYRIDIVDIAGRKVKTLKGVATGNKESVKMNLSGINSGIYFYRFSNDIFNITGKIIIK